jgi:two-component sensor histidine kinase
MARCIVQYTWRQHVSHHIGADKTPILIGDVLRKEADHRIANNLALVVGLVRLRARSVVQKTGMMDREEVRLLLEDVANRVDTVARLHRMLSRPSRQVSVNIGDYLREICESMNEFLAGAETITFLHEVDGACMLPPDQVLSLGLLVSELIANAIKYAHPSGVAGKIRLGCRYDAQGKLIVDISDDGVGLPENFDPTVDGSLGFRLVRSLSEQLGGILNFESDALGTRVRLEMPADRMAAAAE